MQNASSATSICYSTEDTALVRQRLFPGVSALSHALTLSRENDSDIY